MCCVSINMPIHTQPFPLLLPIAAPFLLSHGYTSRSNGELTLMQNAAEISPGKYPMLLACCFTLTMRNETERKGCLRERFNIQVLGKNQFMLCNSFIIAIAKPSDAPQSLIM